MFTDEKIKKMRACLDLLPPPGGEVVGECLDEIEKLQDELSGYKVEELKPRVKTKGRTCQECGEPGIERLKDGLKYGDFCNKCVKKAMSKNGV